MAKKSDPQMPWKPVADEGSKPESEGLEYGWKPSTDPHEHRGMPPCDDCHDCPCE